MSQEDYGGLVGNVGRSNALCLDRTAGQADKRTVVDALARAGDERRGKLRKASGRCKQSVPFHLYERKEEGWGVAARFARSNMMTLYTIG